jgi:hypothetical protein
MPLEASVRKTGLTPTAESGYLDRKTKVRFAVFSKSVKKLSRQSALRPA